jgi:hypothetical protein
LFQPKIAPAVIKALTAAGVEARYFELDSDLGHSSSGPEHAKWSPVLREFLAPLVAPAELIPMTSACAAPTGRPWALSLFSLLFAAKEQPASWILPRKLPPFKDRDGGETATLSLFSVS